MGEVKSGTGWIAVVGFVLALFQVGIVYTAQAEVTDAEAIAIASRAFSDAYVRNDVETLKSMYTEDAVLLPPGREIRGREAAGEYFRWRSSYRQISHAMTSDDLSIQGDVAVDVGTWHSTGQRGDEDPFSASGRYLVVWKREGDEKWRIQYDMWHRPATPPATASTPEDGFETLVEWMSGSFSSARQAAEDEAFYDIRLEMVPIWPDRKDAAWFYVEQAAAETKDKPYRQRVYRITRIEPGLFKSKVFTLADAESSVGEWRSQEPLKDLSPDDLEVRRGCAVFLRRDESGEFAGGTIGRRCASKLRGASYAVSEVVVGRGRIESWDRGFGAVGAQVWGAEKGPYIFERSESAGDGPAN